MKPIEQGVVVEIINPNQPIATCKSESCDDCLVGRALHCHSSPRDIATFLLIAGPAIVLGSAGIYNINRGMLVPWLVILIGYIGLVELRMMGFNRSPDVGKKPAAKCRTGFSGLNIWKYRHGPMTLRKKVVFLSGFAFVWGYPIGFLLLGNQIFLLIVYLHSSTCFVVTLRSFLCSRCTNFGCLLNSVDDYVRSDFYECNPGIAKLWSRKTAPKKSISGITQIKPTARVIAQPTRNEV